MDKIKQLLRSFGLEAYHLGHVAYFGLVFAFAHGPYAWAAGGLMVLGIVIYFLGELAE